MKLSYNPAIDGLRAISVLAVIAYHAGFGWAAGGYLGVEVFFVISGFLVVALMVDEHATTGRFEMGQFWLRRARRLLPAVVFLLVVVAIVVPRVWPEDSDKLPGQVASAAGYVANWQQIAASASYFDEWSRPPVLRHLWSLAVEEQFYLVFPLVFWWTTRRYGMRGVRVASIALVALFTIVALVVLGGGSLDRSYLGTDARMIGILGGVLLALWWAPWRAAPSRARWGAPLMLVALATIVYAVVACGLSDESRPIDLFWRLRLVDLATILALLAATGPANLLGRALGAAPLAAIGRRSYSLYLWHWPVFAVTRPELDVSPTASMLLRVALTIVLAEASYRGIEAPFRTRAVQRLVRQRRAISRVVFATILLVPALAAASLVATALAPHHASELEAKLAAADDVKPPPPKPSTFDDVAIFGANDTLRARDAIARALPGATIDVRPNRDLVSATKEVVRLHGLGQLRRVVVIEFAQNGAADAPLVASLAGALPGHTLLLVTPRGIDRYSTKLDYDGRTRRAIAGAGVRLIDTMSFLGVEPEERIDQPLSDDAQAGFAALVRFAITSLPARERSLELVAAAARAAQPYDGVLLVGDSVAHAAGGALYDGLPGLELDAKIGRQVPQAIKIVETTAGDPRAQTVVFFVGNNGSIKAEDLDALVAAAGSRRLFVMTLRLVGNRASIANEHIRDGSRHGKRYVVCDWAAFADPHAEWFLDGAHTNAAGDAQLVGFLRNECLTRYTAR
ncbi:MAG TPA: acyltransferase family protein [Kofleriaceae bacterium]|nr:acyltransferase family protein [Kofleriaceae bacterium]